jgi:hypothetical protein
VTLPVTSPASLLIPKVRDAFKTVGVRRNRQGWCGTYQAASALTAELTSPSRRALRGSPQRRTGDTRRLQHHVVYDTQMTARLPLQNVPSEMATPGARLDKALRRVVARVTVLNLTYFGVEFSVALAIGSVSLFADSIDFLEDTSVNFLILIGVGVLEGDRIWAWCSLESWLFRVWRRFGPLGTSFCCLFRHHRYHFLSRGPEPWL